MNALIDQMSDRARTAFLDKAAAVARLAELDTVECDIDDRRRQLDVGRDAAFAAVIAANEALDEIPADELGAYVHTWAPLVKP